MSAVTAREALEYALGRGMLALYGVVLLGYVALLVGGWFWADWAIRGGGAGAVGQLLGALFLLTGFAAILGGLIAVVYKLIADANSVART